jgi:hypothetical protein
MKTHMRCSPYPKRKYGTSIEELKKNCKAQ